MGELFLGEGVRLQRVRTASDLEGGLAPLPSGVRLGMACDLEEYGHALRLDASSRCVYHLRWEKDDIVILTWGPMSTLFEAAVLLSSIKTLAQPMNDDTALRLYRGATLRRAEFRVEPRRHAPVATSSPWYVERLRSVPLAWQRFYRYLRLRLRLPIQASSTS